jgi:3-oxoadipate enol-lactonase
MPFLETGDFRTHYSLSGEAEKPVLMFSNSLGTDLSMWDAQAAFFAKQFRILRYDTRGHGKSSVTPGPYLIEQLGNDVLSLLDDLDFDRVHFCGLSMGGMIGMWLGMNAPERLYKLILCNTAAKIGNAEGWNARIESVRANGMKPIVGGVIERWFTSAFRAKSPDDISAIQIVLQNTNAEGYVANCAAVRDFDARETIATIGVPTLVIAGAHDAATPPEGGRFVAEQISGAQYAELSAAHISNIEDRDRFNQEVSAFLAV